MFLINVPYFLWDTSEITHKITKNTKNKLFSPIWQETSPHHSTRYKPTTPTTADRYDIISTLHTEEQLYNYLSLPPIFIITHIYSYTLTHDLLLFSTKKAANSTKKGASQNKIIIKTASTTDKTPENTINLHFSLHTDKKHHLIIQKDTSQQLRQLLINMI